MLSRNGPVHLQCRENSQSLLLWLSIVRRVFAPPDASVPIASAREVTLVSRSGGDLKHVQGALLQISSLVQALVSYDHLGTSAVMKTSILHLLQIECFSSGDQLVCYLASKVLHLTLLASQWSQVSIHTTTSSA